LHRQRELTTALTETTPVVARPTNLKDIEKQHINELMERYGGNRKMVADALGVSERTIYRKLKKLGINQAGVSLAT
jgi:DNA-binding NtrC family response regulator